MRRTLAGLVLGAIAIGGVAPAAQAIEPEPSPNPEPIVLERIELQCRKAVVKVTIADQERDKLVIGCRWSQSQRRNFAGYKVYRKVDDQARHLWFATRNRERTKAIDWRVQRDHTYTYRLVVVNPDGRIIGISNKVSVST